MPIYEYQCTSCNHLFDLIQKINEPPVTLCPACSEHKLIKLVSAAGFQLKGTGWYATDFKNSGNPNKAKTQATDSAATEASSKDTPKPAAPAKGDSE
ncbi:MAG: FmdB family zinc ribbon protein [Legionellales bacterium]